MADPFVINDGALYLAPFGTTAPANDAIPSGPWVSYGDVNEDGLTLGRSYETNAITSGFTGAERRKPKTSEDFTFQLNFLDDLEVVRELWHGVEFDDDDSVPGVRVATRGPITPTKYALVFDAFDDGTETVHRYFEPNVEVSERGDTPYQVGEATIYPITFAAFTGDDASGLIASIPLSVLTGGS